MGSSAYIHLSAQTGENLAWVGLEGRSRTDGARHVAAAVARLRVVAVVPGVDVLVQTLPMPKASWRNLLRALPFLLEEKVASPLENLHFSLGPPLEGGQRPVAVIEAGLMEQWLAVLDEAGIRPDAMVSETLLLPWEARTWTLLQTPERALLRTGSHTGLAMDSHNVPFMLGRALADTDLTTRPDKLVVFNYLPEPLALPLPDGAGVIVEESRPDVDPLAFLARNALETGGLNLLQGRFGAQGRWEGLLRPLRLTALLLLLWLFVKLGVLFVASQRMETQVAALDGRMQDIFSQSFPGSRPVRPEAQMREKVKRLQQEAGGGQEFLDLLIQTGPPVLAAPGTVVERIHYQEGLLDLYLHVRDLESLNKLKQTIEAAGRMTVTIRSAVKQGSSVDSHLQIKGM